MAAAIGVGIDVLAPEGNMIVDIGGGTTEIAVISLGGIVSNKSIRMAGDDLTADIVEYMRRQHNVKVSERMAERIKINVGSALTVLEDARGLRGSWSESDDCLTDGGTCLLSGDRPLLG